MSIAGIIFLSIIFFCIGGLIGCGAAESKDEGVREFFSLLLFIATVVAITRMCILAAN